MRRNEPTQGNPASGRAASQAQSPRRRPNPVLAQAIIGSLVLVLASSVVAAETATVPGDAAIRGELLFTHAEILDPSTTTSHHAKAGYSAASSMPLKVDWSLTGAEIVVQWWNASGVGVANPLSQTGGGLTSLYTGSASGSQGYTDGRAHGSGDSYLAKLLVILNDAAGPHELDAHLSADTELQPALGQRWFVGPVDEGPVESSGPPLRKTHQTQQGHALVRAQNASAWQLSGGFSVYLWQVMATVEDADRGPDEYRSGQWSQGGIGGQVHPGGVVFESHRQLLALHVTDGTLDVRMETGDQWFEAAALKTFTVGAVAFDVEKAYLETQSHYYSAEHQVLRLDGTLQLETGRAADSGEHLSGTVTGHALNISIPPSGAIAPAPEAPSPAAAEGAQAAGAADAPGRGHATTAVPGTPLWFVAVLWSAAILVLAALAIWWVLRRAGLLHWYRENLPLIVRAEQALFAGRGAQARRLARRALRKDPTDADAWMILGTAWAQDDRLDKVVEALAPAVPRLTPGDGAGPAFLLALACARQNQRREALGWLKVAGKEPEMLERIRLEPTFDPLRSSPHYRKLFGEAPHDAAYL